MQKNRRNILSTRPLKDAIIRRAEAENIIIDYIPFIETKAIKNDSLAERIHNLSAQKITAVFTSMNAVDAVKTYLETTPPWELFCIGSATKDAVAETFGETSIRAVASYGGDLAERIIEQGLKEVFFFCGDQRREELPAKLKEENITVEEVVVYHTITLKKTVTKNYDGILFFSPSAVQSFFSANSISADVKLFAIGNTTADTLKQIVNNDIIVADKPGKESLVEKMMAYFDSAHKTIN